MSGDNLGDRLKEKYEDPETSRKFLTMLPVYARIDGRGFSKFTKGMERPYDERMINAMVATTKYLVDQTNAILGFAQSDEISLLWYYPGYKSEMMFDRKIQKITSVLAGMATAAFHISLRDNFPENYRALQEKMPHFDARAFSLPNLDEAANAILWRTIDASKNSVSMAAHHYFSHKSLQGVNSADMQERLFQEVGINYNDHPSRFKQGTFVRKITTERSLTEEERIRIPVDKRPEPGMTFVRSSVEEIEVPVFSRVINRVGFIFNNEQPTVENVVSI